MPPDSHAVSLIAVLVLASPVTAHAADAEAGQAVFRTQCGVFHSPLPGKKVVGPSLFGVVGRKSGSVEGFRYSANKAAGITWNAEILDNYLAVPREVVPGTIMTYAGLKDDAKRADLIAWLETLQ